MKKFSLVLIVLMVFGCLPVQQEALCAENGDSEIASIVFDKRVKTQNISKLIYNPLVAADSGENMPIIEYIDGEYALRRIKQSDSTMHLGVDIDDRFIYSEEAVPLDITVEYYDLGLGSFSIQYMADGEKKDAEVVELKNSKKWIKYTFHFDDIQCGNQYNGGTDFRIALWTNTMKFSTTDVYIKSVEVAKSYYKEPIKLKAETEVCGRIFGGDENKEIRLIFENITDDEISTEASYTINDESGNIIGSGEFEVNQKGREAKEHLLDLNGITKYGVYTIDVIEISRVGAGEESRTTENHKTFDFSVINKAKQNERNMNLWANTHANRYNPSETAELAAYAGFGGVRDLMDWCNVERTKGIYEATEKFDEYVKLVNENNLEMLLVLAGGNKLYSGRTDAPPDTPEGHKAFTGFAKFLAERYRDEVNYYEIWNEYNLDYFNPKKMDAKNYLNFQAPVYKAIKEVDPNAFVVGITNGVVSKAMFEDYNPYFEQGSLNYLDAVGYHNYRDFLGRYKLIDDVEFLRNKIKSYGSEKGVWITEIGLTICEGEGHTDAERAETYIKSYSVAVGEELSPLFAYDLECDGQMKSNREHNFGLVNFWKDADNPHTAYGSFVTVAGLNKLMYDKSIKRKIRDDNGVWGYDFANTKNEDVATIWSEDGAKSIGVKLGTDSVEVLDMYSNSLGTLKSDNGVFNIGISGRPIYLKGNFTEFALCEPNVSLENVSVSGVENDIIAISAADKMSRRLRIEAGLPDCIELYGGNQGENGRTEIELKTKSGSLGVYYVPITVYDGENICCIAEAEVTVNEPISVTLSVERTDKLGSSRWSVLAKVKNESNTMPKTGSAQIVESDEQPYKSNKAVFSYLMPGETTTLYLNLDEMKRLRKKSVSVNVDLNDGYSKQFEGEFDFSFAEYASAKPAIDGVISQNEWSGMWVSAYEKADIKSIAGWVGESDLSFDAVLQYDDKNLYLAAVVKDDVHCNTELPNRIWSGDSIQFAIEDGLKMGDAVQVPGMESNFTELGIALSNDKPVVYRYKSQDSVLPLGEVENCSAAIKRGDGKTVYELEIPWTELFRENYVLDDSRILGFSMLVNDNDGAGRRGWIEYNSGVGMTKNAMLFGKLNFVKNNK